MNQICIHVPAYQRDQTIELAVTIDGKRRLMNYRVESFLWPPGNDLEEKINRLKDFILSYDASWELVQIGTPSEDLLPVMFRQRQT